MPLIGTVLLSHNRLHLLKKTVESYLATVSVPHELVIVDTASDDQETRDYLMSLKRRGLKVVLCRQNNAGMALNVGIEKTTAPFVHTSDNDLEYLPGWDKELLSKFDAFSELGQISLFGIRADMARKMERYGQVVYATDVNVGTPSIFLREIWDKGVRWKSKRTESNVKMPADARFSRDVMHLGYLVAWNDKHTVINWGHDVAEWIAHPDYYLANYRAKNKEDVFREKLRDAGYELTEEDGRIVLKKLPQSASQILQ